MRKSTRSYQDDLVESLKDPDEAAAYLNAHLKDEEGNSEELFLRALRNIAQAQGFSSVAESAGVGRESMYKSLSDRGNPRIKTFQSILNAVGLRLAVEVGSKHAVGQH